MSVSDLRNGRKHYWSLDYLPRLDGKTFIVTGANSGMGLEVTRVFAGAGATVVMACRNPDKAKTAIDCIHKEASQASLEFLTLDLSSLSSIRVFAEKVSERFHRIDALCNNAGVCAIPYDKTQDGFEMQFGVNYLGTFALTGLLFEKLSASTPSRVVNVSSFGHRFSRGINFDDLQSSRAYDKVRAYNDSKLAVLLFTYEMDRRIRERHIEIKSIACNPGMLDTPLADKMERSWFEKHISHPVIGLLLSQSAAAGAISQVYASVGDDADSGDFVGPDHLFGLRGLPTKTDSSNESHDLEVAKRLWTVAEELTGVSFL